MAIPNIPQYSAVHLRSPQWTRLPFCENLAPTQGGTTSSYIPYEQDTSSSPPHLHNEFPGLTLWLFLSTTHRLRNLYPR